ncbi:hypothetical protein UPYG_G00289780 [Umbra pygmaea]|uniref:Ig-like domain-containing protein n=1 Tax=Umbra pygmaea TaxID=75934 RepID=A0ABD0W661_UMBPY
MFLYTVFLLSALVGDSNENDIKPNSETEHVLEGSSVTLSCNYSGSVYTLQWYRQYPRSAPQLLVMEHMPPTTPGFTLEHVKDAKRVHLKISSAEVTDTALYYCALRPTVTGNPETLYKNLPYFIHPIIERINQLNHLSRDGALK